MYQVELVTYGPGGPVVQDQELEVQEEGVSDQRVKIVVDVGKSVAHWAAASLQIPSVLVLGKFHQCPYYVGDHE
ncbi:hypothetical protein AVEN_128300-1 [Araneus ventricosus]|uniref:Uncharacterized protein n=1 Tax=Araneus ventricosus TaxID=182803 RepID=A0A4Y2V3J0_ARAVE|nr:hypothetical protein AVEN_128300-1 [Araneus ventricosus]